MRLQLLFTLAVLSFLFFSCGKDKNVITLEAQTFEVLESITDAETIGKIVATSSEEIPLSFKLIDNSDGLFKVAPDGVVGLATGRRLNFNTAATHQITIEVSDGSQSKTATITINLVSVLLTLEAQTFEVLETIGEDEEIGTITSTTSSTNPLTYRMVENSDDLFYVNERGGCGLATGKRLNYKTAATHQISVEVTDGFKTATNTININVIDVEQPFITKWKTDNYGESNDNQIMITIVDGLSYDYNVDWGDGTNDTNVTSHITHTYATVGTYTVSISGTFPAIYNDEDLDAEKIVSIEQWGDIEWKTMADAFKYCKHVTLNAIDAPGLSEVISMKGMFEGAHAFNGDLSNWDVSTITDMSQMFSETDSFNGNISTWDVSSVTNMEAMFTRARQFNSDISNWNVSNVTDMGHMFSNAAAFNGDISDWDVSSVTNMTYMFRQSPFNGDLSDWDVSNVSKMSYMFRQSPFNGDISSWNVAKATNMRSMFRQADQFNQDLSKWDVSNVTDMSTMFRDSGLSMDNYDALLIGWSKLAVQPNVQLGVGNTNYSGHGVAPRAILTGTYNWAITDGGPDF